MNLLVAVKNIHCNTFWNHSLYLKAYAFSFGGVIPHSPLPFSWGIHAQVSGWGRLEMVQFVLSGKTASYQPDRLCHYARVVALQPQSAPQWLTVMVSMIHVDVLDLKRFGLNPKAP